MVFCLMSTFLWQNFCFQSVPTMLVEFFNPNKCWINPPFFKFTKWPLNLMCSFLITLTLQQTPEKSFFTLLSISPLNYSKVIFRTNCGSWHLTFYLPIFYLLFYLRHSHSKSKLSPKHFWKFFIRKIHKSMDPTEIFQLELKFSLQTMVLRLPTIYFNLFINKYQKNKVKDFFR